MAPDADDHPGIDDGIESLPRARRRRWRSRGSGGAWGSADPAEAEAESDAEAAAAAAEGEAPPGRPYAERPRIVAAPDKLRGTATAPQVADAVRRVAVAAGWRCSPHPMADGGEGTLDVVGGPNRTSTVTGPLGDPVDAAWRLEGRTAVVETAQASGLDLVGGPEGNDPVAASTYGTGELLATALEQGARRILVGLGGSATTDGGLGALRALHPHYRLRAVELLVLCDVRTAFVDAAPVFAPQKGASPAQVELLRRRLERLADVYLDDHGVDVRSLEGAGAAGGLAGGLAALGGTLVGGFETLAEEAGLYESVAGADLVVTAEGFLDEESFEGKVVGGVAEIAASHGVPCVAIVGEVLPDIDVDAGGSGGSAGAGVVRGGPGRGEGEGLEIVSLVERFGRSRAEGETVACIEQVVAELLARRDRSRHGDHGDRRPGG